MSLHIRCKHLPFFFHEIKVKVSLMPNSSIERDFERRKIRKISNSSGNKTKYFPTPHQWLKLVAHIPPRPSPLPHPWFYFGFIVAIVFRFQVVISDFYLVRSFLILYEVMPCITVITIRGHWKWPNLSHTHKLKTKINKSGSNRRSNRARYNIVVKKVSFPPEVICWKY